MTVYLLEKREDIEVMFERDLLDDSTSDTNFFTLSEEEVDEIFNILNTVRDEIEQVNTDSYKMKRGRHAYWGIENGTAEFSGPVELKPFKFAHEVGHLVHDRLTDTPFEETEEFEKCCLSEAMAELTAYHFHDIEESEYSEIIPDRNPYSSPDQNRFYAEIAEEGSLEKWREHYEETDLHVDLEHDAANFVGKRMSEIGLTPHDVVESYEQFERTVLEAVDTAVEYGVEEYERGNLERIDPKKAEGYEQRVDQIINKYF